MEGCRSIGNLAAVVLVVAFFGLLFRSVPSVRAELDAGPTAVAFAD